jgi:hypothetical protein
MDIGGWLRRLGLEQYEAAFRANNIDNATLPSLTTEDLKELGVGSVGHRRKLIDAIAGLHAETSAPTPLSDAPVAATTDSAERRHRDVLGPCRFDGALDPSRPGGPARGHFGLSQVRRRYGGPFRGLRRKVHGRRRTHLSTRMGEVTNGQI